MRRLPRVFFRVKESYIPAEAEKRTSVRKRHQRASKQTADIRWQNDNEIPFLLTRHFYKTSKVGFINTRFPYIYAGFLYKRSGNCIFIHRESRFSEAKPLLPRRTKHVSNRNEVNFVRERNIFRSPDCHTFSFFRPFFFLNFCLHFCITLPVKKIRKIAPFFSTHPSRGRKQTILSD